MCYTRPDLEYQNPRSKAPCRRGAPWDVECQGTRARRSRDIDPALPIPWQGSRSQKKAPGYRDPARSNIFLLLDPGPLLLPFLVSSPAFLGCVVVGGWPGGVPRPLPFLAVGRGRPNARSGSRPGGVPCLSPICPLTKTITNCIITVTVAHVRNQYWSYHTRSLTRQRDDNIAAHSRGLTGVGCFYIPGSYAHRSGGRVASILVQGWQPTQTACPEGGSPRQSPVGPRTRKETCPVVCCRPTGRGY